MVWCTDRWENVHWRMEGVRVISFGFDALETMDCVFFYFFNPCCIYTDRRTPRTEEWISKEPPFARKTPPCAHTSRKSLMPLRACPGGVVHDQSKPMQYRLTALICSEQELTWNGERRPNLKTKSSLPEQFRWLHKNLVRIPTQQELLPSPSQLSSQLHHYLRHVFMLS